jgi:hypothetical protein
MGPGRAAKPYRLCQLSLRAPRRGNGCGENLKSLDVSAILVINKEWKRACIAREKAREDGEADPGKGLSKRDAMSGTPFLGPMRNGIILIEG